MSTRKDAKYTADVLNGRDTRPVAGDKLGNVTALPGADVTRETQCHNHHESAKHGIRFPDEIKNSIAKKLLTQIGPDGRIPSHLKSEQATLVGTSVQSINRWVREYKATVIAHAEQVNAADDLLQVTAPAAFYKVTSDIDPLEPDEIAFIGRHGAGNIGKAIEEIKADPNHRLSHLGTSTIYRKYGQVAAPIRHGVRDGHKAGRKVEMTVELSGKDLLNAVWTIDEFDLKVYSRYGKAVIEPKLLVVRDRASGLPLAYKVLAGAATSADACQVIGAAAAGWERNGIRVEGSPELLVSDNGGPFASMNTQRAMLHIGTGCNPIESYAPQANGDHEQIHQSLLNIVHPRGGSRRGHVTRSGKRLDHGVITFDGVLDRVDQWARGLADAVYAKGPHKGMSRWNVYTSMLESGQKFENVELSDEALSHLAVPVFDGPRRYDPTRGLKTPDGYLTGVEFARTAEKSQLVTIKQLLDPSTFYAFDRDDRFIGKLSYRHLMSAADQVALHKERGERARMISDIGHARALMAQRDAKDLETKYRDDNDEDQQIEEIDDAADAEVETDPVDQQPVDQQPISVVDNEADLPDADTDTDVDGQAPADEDDEAALRNMPLSEVLRAARLRAEKLNSVNETDCAPGEGPDGDGHAS